MARTVFRAATFALVFVALAWPAAATSCRPADSWFVQRASLTQPETVLPDGVSLRVVSGHGGNGLPVWDDASESWIELRNTTSTPLYLLVRAETFRAQMGYERISWPNENLNGLAGELNAYLKVESGLAYYWPYNCAVVSCDQIGWLSHQQPIVVSDGLWGISPGFEQRNVRKRDRPANVAVPGPQSATMTLGYGGKVITVPFVVTYELNRSYDPAVGTNPGECGSGLAVFALVALVALIAVVSGAAIVVTKLIATVGRRIA